MGGVRTRSQVRSGSRFAYHSAAEPSERAPQTDIRHQHDPPGSPTPRRGAEEAVVGRAAVAATS
jgi:hypothetical protein